MLQITPHMRAESDQPLSYLVALFRHADDVASQPDDWLPWNYAQRQAELA